MAILLKFVGMQLNSLLLEACRSKGPEVSLNVLELLLQQGADLECRDKLECTPLFLSVYSNNRLRAAVFLLRSGTNPDIIVTGLYPYNNRRGYGETDKYSPLSRAVEMNAHGTAALLLQYGANVANPSHLDNVMSAEDLQMVRLFLDAGVDLSDPGVDVDGLSFMDMSFWRAVFLEIHKPMLVSDLRDEDCFPPETVTQCQFRLLNPVYKKEIACINLACRLGCRAINPKFVELAYQDCAFVTLVHLYKAHVRSGRVMVWTEDFELDELIYYTPAGMTRRSPFLLAYAAILRDFVKRTNSFSENAHYVIRQMTRFLNPTDGSPECNNPARLQDLSHNTVLRVLVNSHRRDLDEAIAQLQVPEAVRRKLRLLDTDLGDRKTVRALALLSSTSHDSLAHNILTKHYIVPSLTW